MLVSERPIGAVPPSPSWCVYIVVEGSDFTLIEIPWDHVGRLCRSSSLALSTDMILRLNHTSCFPRPLQNLVPSLYKNRLVQPLLFLDHRLWALPSHSATAVGASWWSWHCHCFCFYTTISHLSMEIKCVMCCSCLIVGVSESVVQVLLQDSRPIASSESWTCVSR